MIHLSQRVINTRLRQDRRQRCRRGGLLISEWRHELNRLWSIKFSIASALFGLCEVAVEVLPFLSDAIPAKLFAIMSVGAAIGAAIARLVKQK